MGGLFVAANWVIESGHNISSVPKSWQTQRKVQANITYQPQPKLRCRPAEASIIH